MRDLPSSTKNLWVVLGRGLALVGSLIALSGACSCRPNLGRNPTPIRFVSNGQSVELRDLVDVRRRFRHSPYFLAEVWNTGTDVIKFPGIRLIMRYEGTDAARQWCYGSSGTTATPPTLAPGQRAACVFKYDYGPFWDSYRVEFEPLRPSPRREPKLTLLDARLQSYPPIPNGAMPYVDGRVRNDSGKRVEHLSVFATMYDSEGRIVAADSGNVDGERTKYKAGGDIRNLSALEASEVGTFRVYAEECAATPVSFRVFFTGD